MAYVLPLPVCKASSSLVKRGMERIDGALFSASGWLVMRERRCGVFFLFLLKGSFRIPFNKRTRSSITVLTQQYENTEIHAFFKIFFLPTYLKTLLLQLNIKCF